MPSPVHSAGTPGNLINGASVAHGTTSAAFLDLSARIEGQVSCEITTGGSSNTRYQCAPSMRSARNADPDMRDDQAECLRDALRTAVNGQSFAGLTVPDHTYVETSRPLPPRAPERRIEAVLVYQYIVDQWGGEPDERQ